MDFFVAYRMFEAYAAGHKTDASVGVGTWSSVFEIPLDAASYACKLAAYLMMASGKQFNLNQMITLSMTDDAVFQLCQFGFGRIASDYVGFVLFLIADQPVLQKCSIRRRSVVRCSAFLAVLRRLIAA